MLSVEIVKTAIAAHNADRIKGFRSSSNTPYRTELWTFTRYIKSGCQPDSNPETIFDEVDRWIQQTGGWEQIVPNLDSEEIYLEFVSNWRDIRHRTDDSALDRAYRAAQLQPLSHKRYSQNKRLQGYAEFISLAGWLQKQVGNAPIMLPVERVADLLGKTPRTVCRYRQRALPDGDGFMIEVVHHVPGRLATKFRFAVEQFPELKGV